MKYLFATVLFAALLLAAVVATGHSIDAGSVIAILAAAGLPAGMLWDYRNSPRGLPLPRLAQPTPSRPRPVHVTKLARATIFTPPQLVPPVVDAPMLQPRRVSKPGVAVLSLHSS